MASKYDTQSIKTFDNEVLANMLEDQLITSLDMNQFITTDYSMTEAPGMVKRIRKYTGTGNVQELDMGEGNTQKIGSEFVDETYEVKLTQGWVQYFDEQDWNDPIAIEKAIQHLSEQIINDNTTKIVAEFEKATNAVYDFDWSFASIVRAKAGMPDEVNSGLFMLVNRGDSAELMITLEDHLKYVEGFVRSDYIGSIAGIPVYVSDAVPSGEAFIATKEAITCFMKKGVAIETDRDANTRCNDIFGRVVKVIALTNDHKVIKLATDVPFTAVANPDVDDIKDYFERSGVAGSYVFTKTEDTALDETKTYYTANA